MRKITLCFLVLASAQWAALAMPNALASAATTWTVKPGGAVTATSGLATLKDTTSENSQTCPSSGIKATLRNGTGLPGTGIGSGATTATIAGIHGKFAGPSCSYVLDGRGPPQDNGTLVVTYVSATGTVTPPQTITSP
jgi:hypothetical protein